MLKRTQYYIRQFNLLNLNDKYELMPLNDANKEGISQSQNFLFYQTYEKILGKNLKSDDKNYLKEIIAINTGRGATKDEKERLKHILKNGVMLDKQKYLFLDVSLSGSQHKNVSKLDKACLAKIPGGC